MNDEQFVARLFRNYYERAEGLEPPDIHRREFGVGGWSRKIDSRHLAFRNGQELRSYLVRNTPFYVSCSSAYYEFPDGRPMERKGWLGADLVFDLDADHLSLACIKKGEHVKGWVCGKCIDAVRSETVKLIEEFLVPDFGFSKDEISCNFSGNRGFHVHVRSEGVRQLSAYARREIVDYVSGVGLHADSIFFRRQAAKLEGPSPEDPGWYGKIARRFVELLEKEKLLEAGVEPLLARRLYKNKAKVVDGVRRRNWDVVRLTQDDKLHLTEKVIGSVAVPVEGVGRMGDGIDAGVTVDVSKLVRLPNSLHGETGLMAKKISVTELQDFDPMKDAVVFSDAPVRVKCQRVPKFEMRGTEFGPFDGEAVELPEFAAVYLICKRMASLHG